MMRRRKKQTANRNPVAVYTAMQDDIRKQITAGELESDDPLLSEFALAKKYRISRGSVRAGLHILREKGIIYVLPGKGAFVAQKAAFQSAARKNRIALVIPGLEDSDHQIYEGIESVLDEAGFVLSIFNSRRSVEQENTNLKLLLEGEEEGAIIFPNWGRTNAQLIYELKRANYPFVLIDRYFRDLETDYVVTDNKTGGFVAAEHLIQMGHRKIGVILGVQCTAIDDRYAGFMEALAKYRLELDPNMIVRMGKSADREPVNGGYDAAMELLKKQPTAIFATNDFLARDTLKALGAQEMSVPDDISLIGFDNQKFSEDLIPPLTTIAQPFIDIGRKATQILLSKIHGEQSHVIQETLPPKLVVRKTCRKID